jgi:hypothetical protein
MFTKSRIGSLIENLVWGIIIGAIVVNWVFPAFGLVGIPVWIGGVAGGVLGGIYGAASGEDS